MPPDVSILSNPAPQELVQLLRQRIALLEQSRRPRSESPVSSGWERLNQLLPEGGFRRGSLVEWLALGEGGGVESLAFTAAREACRTGGALLVFDRNKQFYPPAAVRLGIAPEEMIVIQAASQADNFWALDQALRCPGLAAAVAWPDPLDARTFRRLQLAAEQGGGLGLLVRPEAARREHSWADIRLAVEPLPTIGPHGPRRIRVHLLRGRGGPSGAIAEIELDHETHRLHLDSPMATPAADRRAAGA